MRILAMLGFAILLCLALGVCLLGFAVGMAYGLWWPSFAGGCGALVLLWLAWKMWSIA